jgi:glycosyltransferase involved in cell wall biosynthesis
MRICLYTETAFPKIGGQEVVVDALARQYMALGHEPTVLAPRPRLPLRANDRWLPYPVVRHPRFYSTRLHVGLYRWFLRRLHANVRFDLIHCHGIYPSGYLAGLLRKRLNVPVVITSQGGDVNPENVRLAKPLLRRRHCEAVRAADALIAISRYTRDGFVRLGADPGRIVDIPNGVDLGPFDHPVDRPAAIPAEIEQGEFLFFIGRLRQRKGVDVLLRALAQLPDNGKVQLVVAGEGDERPHLEGLAASLGLTRRVRFVGAVAGQIKQYYLENSLAGVVPSRDWEAFGLVVLENYAAGRPVIASALPGLENLIERDRTGMTVPPGDAGALANALRNAMQSPTHCHLMGQNALSKVRDFAWHRVAGLHLDLFQELIRLPAQVRSF